MKKYFFVPLALTLLLSTILLGTTLNAETSASASRASNETKKGKALSIEDVTAEEFNLRFYNINPTDLAEVADLIKDQQSLLESDARTFEAKRAELMAKEEEIKNNMQSGKLKDDAELQKEIEQFQKKAGELQQLEQSLRDKQQKAAMKMQEEVNRIITNGVREFIENYYALEGTAIVLVPMMVGYTPKALDFSEKLVAFLNEKYETKKKNKNGSKKSSASTAKSSTTSNRK